MSSLVLAFCVLYFFLLFGGEDLVHPRLRRFANLPPLLMLLLGRQGGVGVHARKLFLAILQDGTYFFFLIVRERQLLTESLEPLLGAIAAHVIVRRRSFGGGWLARILGECAEACEQAGCNENSES